jgi:hypothetical protein
VHGNPGEQLASATYVHYSVILTHRVFGNSGWGDGGGAGGAGYLDWVLCCGEPQSPTWFDDSTASVDDVPWGGTTWEQGVAYCSGEGQSVYSQQGDISHARGAMELCPYRIYCPDGGGNPPVGGRKVGDKWSPMSDGENKCEKSHPSQSAQSYPCHAQSH